MLYVRHKADLSLSLLKCISESYVADEIITSRAGARVRVGNTDAEGRMVMADVLCKLKEQVRLFHFIGRENLKNNAVENISSMIQTR